MVPAFWPLQSMSFHTVWDQQLGNSSHPVHWPTTALAAATGLSWRVWWTKVHWGISLPGSWCLCHVRMAEDPISFWRELCGGWVWDALCPQCYLGQEAGWSSGPWCVLVEVECRLSFPFAGWMLRVTTWLQDVTYAFIAEDRKKQTVQTITTLDGECGHMSMVSFLVWQCND